MVQVCDGAKTKNDMMEQSIHQYKEMYVRAKREFNKVISVSIQVSLTQPLKFIVFSIVQSVRRYTEGAGEGAAGGVGPGGNGGDGGDGGGGLAFLSLSLL